MFSKISFHFHIDYKAITWSTRNNYCKVLWLVGGKFPCAESMHFYSVQCTVHTNTHEKGEARQKSLNVRKLHYFFPLFTFCDVILCNLLCYVTFTFFNVYVLETLHLGTQNVWWCFMKCDVYVLKILCMVQFTLCATTFSNITSCDVNVRLHYVM